MVLKFLGTGTSQGVPVIGCSCSVCRSTSSKDKRLRSSVMISTSSSKKIVIDCGPDFRMQMLENNENQVDAVLFTHEHNDHMIGLDDLRPLIFKNNKNMDLFCTNHVAKEIMARFPYAFAEKKYPGAPSFTIHTITNAPLVLFDEKITPIEIFHYQLNIMGYRFKNLAYITDASYISMAEKEKLKNLEVLIINCLRKTEPHPAHYILPDIIQLQKELSPKKIYLTHISHQFGLYLEENPLLPAGIEMAYDGLEINF